MKTIKFIAYLFYKYYSTGATKSIPYFSTICALVMILILHFFQILILFNCMYLLPTVHATPGMPRFIKYLETALITSPLFLFFFLLIKKNELQSMQYDKSKTKRGYIYLIIYIVLSFSFLVFLLLLKKRN